MSLGMIRAVTYSLFSTERCRQKLMKKGVVQDLIWACLPHQFQFSQFGPGSPYGTIHENPIFEAEEVYNLDDSYNNEPLR
jgi:hypothetical protein